MEPIPEGRICGGMMHSKHGSKSKHCFKFEKDDEDREDRAAAADAAWRI